MVSLNIPYIRNDGPKYAPGGSPAASGISAPRLPRARLHRSSIMNFEMTAPRFSPFNRDGARTCWSSISTIPARSSWRSTASLSLGRPRPSRFLARATGPRPSSCGGWIQRCGAPSPTSSRGHTRWTQSASPRAQAGRARASGATATGSMKRTRSPRPPHELHVRVDRRRADHPSPN